MALNVAALAGGVGGAKLVDGLAELLPAGHLTVIVNTGDDFDHLGLMICPDLDTVTYTLAGIAHPERGWGRRDESWNFLDTLEHLGGPVWFRLGDRDLALHMERTRRMQAGESLSAVTAHFCETLGITTRVLPMSDEPVRTVVDSDQGELAFQEYFVALRCAPKVTGFRFAGLEKALPANGVLEALQDADIVVLCPSNPWVSLDPILALAGVEESMRNKAVVGVSPIVAGQSIKGPASKMYAELGFEPSALSVAEHYSHLLSIFFIDHADHALASSIEEIGVHVCVTDIVMKNRKDRIRLARETLEAVSSDVSRKVGA